MLDAHCHVDLYADPSTTAAEAERAGVFTVVVTNLPSAFDAAYPNVQAFKRLRLALGLHPLCADSHTPDQLRRFELLVRTTSFVGEVGLDFSREFQSSRERQLQSFRFVLRCLNAPKFVTIHSRQAESEVLDLVAEEYGRPVVLHWFTGALKALDRALDNGHYFSINPAMTGTKRGQAIIARIPPERTLTESDGPFINVRGRPIVPADVQLAEVALADIWGCDPHSARRTIAENCRRLIAPLGSPRSTGWPC